MASPTLRFLLTAVLVAGCLSNAPPSPLSPVPPLSLNVEALALPFLEQDHAHNAEPEAHAATIGFGAAHFAPARTTYPAGETYFELAVKGGYAYVSFGPFGSGPLGVTVAPNTEAGLIIYDVRTPTAPIEVGRWIGQPLSDIEVSDDGNWAFVSTQRNGFPYPYTIDADALPMGQLPRGTYILDVRDKAHPTFAGFAPLPPNGPHTITYVRLPDGRELLLQCTYDLIFTDYPQNIGQVLLTQKVVLSEILPPTNGLRNLQPLSVFQILDPNEGEKEYFPHDATVHIDPTTGRVIMDVAYWDHGLVTVDITDPSRPQELARFADTGPSQYTKTHLVRVFPGTIGGKVVGVLEPEIPTGTDAGQYTFVDLTDPAQPQRLGSWALPGDHRVDKPFVFSPHNFDPACAGNGQQAGGPIDYGAPCLHPTMVAAHFHGGLWTLDASDPMHPRATGFFFPRVERTGLPDAFPFTGFVNAALVDGLVFAPETWTGLYVVELAA